MYLRFLGKDIFKNKVLYACLVFCLFFQSVLFTYGITALQTEYQLHTLWLNFSIKEKQMLPSDREKLYAILKNEQYHYRSFVEKYTKQGYKFLLFGKFDLEKNTPYSKEKIPHLTTKVDPDLFEKLNVSLLEWKRLMSHTNGGILNEEKFAVVEYTSLPPLKEIEDTMFYDFLSHLSSEDEKFIQALQEETFDSMKIHFRKARNLEHEMNRVSIVQILSCTFLFQIIFFYTLFKFTLFKQGAMYLIHQFYGANVKHLLLRSGLYFVSLLPIVCLLAQILRAPMEMYLLVMQVFILWILFFVEVTKQFRGGRKICSI